MLESIDDSGSATRYFALSTWTASHEIYRTRCPKRLERPKELINVSRVPSTIGVERIKEASRGIQRS